MPKLNTLVLSSLVFASAPVLAASELGVAVSADAVTFNYGHFSDADSTRWGLMGLYNDSESASLLSAYFNVVGRANADSDIYTGLGLKAAVYDAADSDASLAIGGNLEYTPLNWSGFGVEGQLYYSPDILSTGDVDKYFDFLVRFSYRINDSAKVFIGWQNIEIGYEGIDADFEVDNSVNLGFALRF